MLMPLHLVICRSNFYAPCTSTPSRFLTATPASQCYLRPPPLPCQPLGLFGLNLHLLLRLHAASDVDAFHSTTTTFELRCLSLLVDCRPLWVCPTLHFDAGDFPIHFGVALLCILAPCNCTIHFGFLQIRTSVHGNFPLYNFAP